MKVNEDDELIWFEKRLIINGQKILMMIKPLIKIN